MDKSANVNEDKPASGLGKLLVARGKLAEPDLQRAEQRQFAQRHGRRRFRQVRGHAF